MSAITKKFLTASQKLKVGIWPWDTDIRGRLPLHFKIRFIEKHMREPIPVHYRPDPRKFVADEFGQKTRVYTHPILPKHTKLADEGLWGGEGLVDGLKVKDNDLMKQIVPALWRPALMKKLFYSEILDRWMTITVTHRTLDLIDEAYGFDYYILKTHEVDLRSKLGMELKKEMFRALVRKSLYPDDSKKREEIYAKYQQFVIPDEEIDWLGLSIYEAEKMQSKLEEEERLRNIVPLKRIYIRELVEQLKEDEKERPVVSGAKKLLSKISPFKEKPTES